jgi:hypothetical protein
MVKMAKNSLFEQDLTSAMNYYKFDVEIVYMLILHRNVMNTKNNYSTECGQDLCRILTG